MRHLLASHGDEDRVCFGGAGARTRAQLLADVERIARILPDAAPGARVVLACVDRYLFSAALLAVWRRGLVAALPPNGQPESVRELRDLEGVVELLHDREESLGRDIRALVAGDLAAERGTRARGTAQAGAGFELARPLEHTALVVYTSGSTGEPSAHEKTYRQLLAEPSVWIEHFDLARRRVVSAVPPHHIYGLLFGVLLPLLGGGSMSRRTPVMPAEVLRELADAEAPILVSVPPHLRALAAYRELPWPRLERVFSSAAPLPEATDQALAARGVRATQVLGSTETGGIAFRQGSHELWRPLPGVSLELEAHGAEDGSRAPGEGCLVVRSDWASPTPGQPVRTADRVRLERAGFVHLGRVDHVIKVAGRRVDLRELELRLAALPGVSEARVIEAGGPSLRGAELWAVVECPDGAERTPAELKRALLAHVDPVVVPRRFRVVRALPRAASGKVTRAALLALFEVWRLPAEELPDGRLRVPIPAELGYFRGHFSEQPILAGVVQLQQIALRQARRRWPELGAIARVTRVKFKRLVGPGEELFLQLARKNERQVQFELSAADGPVSSGMLHFRERAAGAGAQGRSIS
jgi:acyl-coenzyme A synthetase/AMP-(fatty) acid ligase